METDYLVIDTEGTPLLREIAVLDGRGQVLYHAYAQESAENQTLRRPLEPLPAILARSQTTCTSENCLIFNKRGMELR